MIPRVAMWVQTRLGLGHLSRASVLCGALAAGGFHVTLIHGGAPSAMFRLPDGVKLAQLPVALAPDLSSSDLFDEFGKLVDDTWTAKRILALQTILSELNPDIFITETYPLGRRLFHFELAAALAQLRSRTPRPLIVASVRDIVTRPEKPAKAASMIDTSLRLYDLILCHSDAQIMTLSAAFPETAALAEITRHTGYVVGDADASAPSRQGVVVVAGGGAVGSALFDAALAANARWSRDREPWTLVAGPRFDEHALKKLRERAPPGLIVEGSVGDLPARYKAARLVVGQAGYNTVCEVLKAGARLTVVPYATAKETEQTIRAETFAKRGLLTWVAEAALTPDTLIQAMEKALDVPQPGLQIDFDGAKHSAEVLRQALQGRAV